MSVIDVKNLTFAYEGSYDNVFENLSFRIDTDWKLGFVGRNGRGKTTLLRLLMGKYPYSGTITASVQFAYFPFEVADKSLDAAQVMRGILGDFEDWRLSRELGLLEIGEDVLGRPFASLSNGEQTKLLLAALFLRENSFLLIDEPTNHLDALGRKTVGRYLNAKSGFILVSHDRAFLDDCTGRFWMTVLTISWRSTKQDWRYKKAIFPPGRKTGRFRTALKRRKMRG